MQKYLKAGILTLVLVLPALLILFLHGFAENHFQLPYLVPLTDTSGNVRMNGKDTLFYQVPAQNLKAATIVSFSSGDTSAPIIDALSIVGKLASNEINVIRIAGEDVEEKATQIYRVVPLKKAKSFKTIPFNEQFLLIDSKGFIRGIYDGTNTEEIERLTAEVKILLDIHSKEKQ